MPSFDNLRIFQFSRVSSWPQVLKSSSDLKVHFFASGREAIFQLIRSPQFAHLTQPVILLPAFVPQGLYFPFKYSNWEIILYKLDQTGNPDLEDLAAKIEDKKPTIAVLNHLFGITRSIDDFKAAIGPQTLLIEDYAHAYFSTEVSQKGDYILYSPPKLVGTTDGCVFIQNTSTIQLNTDFKRSWRFPAYLFLRIARISSNSLIRYLALFEKPLLLLSAILHRLSYRILMQYCTSPHPMSLLGHFFFNHTNHQNVYEKRIEIVALYRQLLQNEHIRSLIPTESPNFPMIGFPIWVTDRPHFIQYLRRHRISGTYFFESWNYISQSEESSFMETIELMNHHYLLPTHHKLNLKSISKICTIVNAYKAPEKKKSIPF